MSERPLPRGETVPPEGESDEPQLDEEAEAEEHDELDEQARREGEEEDDLVGAHRLYIRAVLEHFGADAPVWPCPTCESRGYTLAALQSDPSVHRCPACLGLGETATGSLVEGRTKRPCPTCRGEGYVEDFVQPHVADGSPAAESFRVIPPEEFPEPVVTPLTVGAAV